MICFSRMKLSCAGAGPRTRHGAAAAFAATIALASFASPPAQAGTTVTRYQYNADGAMTAVTTRVDGGEASTSYLTWDDFVPNEDDPATGTVYSGNGNLLAIGPKPGSGSSLFAFDNRDRLTSFSGADKSAAYGYHADGLMASSTAADDSGFGFYYAGSSMSNLHQTDTDRWSARLGAVRYLDDGSEEVLLTPRKDVAATYDPSSNTVSSYDYDSFGAEADAPLFSGYDLKDNPHRYAGEYRDPLWGGYYLQARWYDPDLAIFLSRDPAAGFHPYSYSDGNPVMMVDPTGTSAQTSGHATGEKAWGSILFNVFVAPVISIFTKEYWSDVAHNRGQAATFLAAGIAAEFALGALDYAAVSAAWRQLSAGTHWLVQNEVDVALNVGQAAVSATHGGKFDASAFGQNLEGLPMGMFYGRGLAGVGRRTHTLRAADIARRVEALGDDTALIFRARRGGWTSPVLEQAKLGLYHDNLVAVSKYYVTRNHIKFDERIKPGRKIGYTSSNIATSFEAPLNIWWMKYQYVGKVDLVATKAGHYVFHNQFSRLNPNGFYTTKVLNGKSTLIKPRGIENVKDFNYFTNNCRTHVQASIYDLRTGPYHMQ